jgi:hypothetical protein
MSNPSLTKKIAGDLANKYGVPIEAVLHAMTAGRGLAIEELREGQRLAEFSDPQLACAVLAAVPRVRLVAGLRGLELRPERLLDDQGMAELQSLVAIAERAARAMMPPEAEGAPSAYQEGP